MHVVNVCVFVLVLGNRTWTSSSVVTLSAVWFVFGFNCSFGFTNCLCFF